jgi:hypothetical protein
LGEGSGVRASMPRTFTLEEARALLPEIREIAQAMRDRKRAFDEKQAVLKQAGRHVEGNGHGPRDALTAQTDAERLVQEIQDRIQHLAELGVEVKGIDQGLVDFPSLRDGRMVYLCWRIGEPDILYWHELNTGFRGRQPL